MIECKHLSYRSKQIRLGPLDCKLQNGSVLGVLGDRDEERSLLLALLSGALAPTDGEIRINGFSMTGESRRAKKQIGYLPPHSFLTEELTVTEQLFFAMDAYALEQTHTLGRMQRLLEAIELTEKRGQLIRRLSLVEKRRLELALALLHEPECLLLDNPFASLPTRACTALWELLDTFAPGKTIFIGAKRSTELRTVVDRFLLFEDGALASILDAGDADTDAALDAFDARYAAAHHAKAAPARHSRLSILFEKNEEEIDDAEGGADEC